MGASQSIGYMDAKAILALRALYATMKNERGIADGSPAATDLAESIVRAYLHGTTRDCEIYQLLNRRQAA